jgi:CBS-domain-containing membrane protein
MNGRFEMITAKEIMSTDVITVTPDIEIKKLAALFAEKGVSGFPVVDEGGNLVGVVTESDLIHQKERLHIPTVVAIFDAVITLGDARTEEELQRMAASTAGEVMTKPATTITPETSMAQIATLMGDNHVHTLPVVDGEGNMVGVVGKRDLIRAMAG